MLTMLLVLEQPKGMLRAYLLHLGTPPLMDLEPSEMMLKRVLA